MSWTGGRAVGRSVLLTLALLSARPPDRVTAQRDSVTQLRWFHPVLAGGAIALLTTFDDDARDFFQRNRTSTSDDVSAGVRWVGAGANAVGIVAGVTLAGVVTREPRVTKAGLRSGAAVLLAEAVTWTLKPAVGRSRPYQDSSQYDFDSFGGRLSFPSGHATVSFALATVYSDALDHPAATVGLYGLATVVAWSRLNDDEHWLSDVTAGALIGTAAGKIVDGRWRVFGLRPPAVLFTDDRIEVRFVLR